MLLTCRGQATAQTSYGSGLSETDDPNYYTNYLGQHVQATSAFVALDFSTWNMSSVAENARTMNRHQPWTYRDHSL
jgi:hypothetical protein